MFDIVSFQGNCRLKTQGATTTCPLKLLKTERVTVSDSGEDVEKLELSYSIIGYSIKRYNRVEKTPGRVLES